jgi:hypothetical protein
VAPPVEPPPPAPPAPPAQAWLQAVAGLKPASRTIVRETTAFLRYEDGLLVLAARTDREASRARELVRDADFAAHLAGFRNVEIRVGDLGRTGREARSDATARIAERAKADAAGSTALGRVVRAFGGTLEEVEPLGLDAAFVPEPEEGEG